MKYSLLCFLLNIYQILICSAQLPSEALEEGGQRPTKLKRKLEGSEEGGQRTKHKRRLEVLEDGQRPKNKRKLDGKVKLKNSLLRFAILFAAEFMITC